MGGSRREDSPLPMCACCKKVRGDDGSWKTIDPAAAPRSPEGFSHSLCPDCARKIYPEEFDPDRGEGDPP